MAKAALKQKPTIIDRAAERAALIPVPTPERLAHARGDVRVGADGVRRMEDEPLLRLATRQCLDRNNKDRNTILHQAGDQYYSHWYLSGLNGLGAIDYGAGSKGEGLTLPTSAMPSSERVAYHRGQFRGARDCLGMYFYRVLDPIILDWQDPAEVGCMISGHANLDRGRAIAVDRLSEGLHRLAIFWGTLQKDH